MVSQMPAISQEAIDALPQELQQQIPHYSETHQPKIYATLTVCTIIAYASMGLRLYARHVQKQKFGLDDLCIVCAVFFTTISVGLVGYLTHLGLGRHEIVIVLERIHKFDALNNTIVAASATYLPIIFFIKASALFLYCRLFPNKRFHITCYCILAFTALYALAAMLVLTISCLPPYPPTPEEPVAQLRCPNMHLGIIMLSTLATNVILDGIIICLPLPLIWRLQTNIWKKVQLTIVFTLGSFIFIISILRLVAIFQLNRMDDNWGSTDVQLWSIAESAVAILTVSLPVIQPLIRSTIRRQDGSSRFTRLTGSSNQKPVRIGEAANQPIDLLTFGRSGKKGPSRRLAQYDLDHTTVGSVTLVDDRNISESRLVAEG